MAVTGFVHHIGTFFVFVSVVFLVVVCITAPVVHDLAILKVELGSARTNSEHASVSFGTFGWCINDPRASDQCSASSIGYDPAAVMNGVDNTQFSDYAQDSTRRLTRAMILHPIAAGINFIAFMMAIGSGFFGSFIAALTAGFGCLVTVVVLIIDFVMFSVIRSNVNDDNTDADAYFSVGIWLILLSGICSLIGSIILVLTCCSARLHRRRSAARGDVAKNDYGTATTTRRRRWF